MEKVSDSSWGHGKDDDRARTVFRIERTYRPVPSGGKLTPPQGGTGTMAKPRNGRELHAPGKASKEEAS